MKNQFKLLSTAILSSAFSIACVSNPTTQESENVARIIEYTSPAEGFHTKTYFYEGQEEVVAFDAQFTEKFAQEAIDYLRQFTLKPITWLVITHPNPDKFNGASVFQNQGAKVVASRATKESIPGVHAYKKYFFVEMAKMFTEESYPQEAVVDESFETSLSLGLKGGKTIELMEYNKEGVSSNQTVALLPDQKALVVGDLVHHKAHSWLEGGIQNSKASPNLDSWIEVLEKIKSDFDSNLDVLGGRGKVTKLETAIQEQIQYLEVADEIVREYIVSLGVNQSELKEEKANDHYVRIRKEFENEFQDYELSYMIQFGVYGLVNSKIQ